MHVYWFYSVFGYIASSHSHPATLIILNDFANVVEFHGMYAYLLIDISILIYMLVLNHQ